MPEGAALEIGGAVQLDYVRWVIYNFNFGTHCVTSSSNVIKISLSRCC